MVSRLDLRASVVLSPERADGLVLTIRTVHEDHLALRDHLPGRFSFDGNLETGTLALVDDPAGGHVVTYCGDGVRQREDYVQLPLRALGFPAAEPLAPVGVTATTEPGLVVLDQVPRGAWVPRRWADDPRVARVRELLRRGLTRDQVVRRLTVPDADTLQRLLAGEVDERDVPGHVLILARAS